MKIELAAQGFASMGSEARLTVLRCLVRAGESGLSIGDIQDRTRIAPSTLAHHLKFLTGAELVQQEKQGRTIINRANFERLRLLASFILSECCADTVDLSALGDLTSNDNEDRHG
ncbi:transcriptional regulator, ArsR family [Cohaesibacter sp. ES.047]|uniref:ArsR/SmtB family transcription factor n=1 Tax=Cohaesibacter sp. ES.047 TaxID=1798205 RepID=UPI000BB8B833|nr:metalloregulator ArsR/SmtB family transcription factor [Cohaesibacter sp. ES.047]SNY93346.1 transcriptional regulator, ArsR family [Cohaesibacter sp. ES.047]